jgi:hypothetical protein
VSRTEDAVFRLAFPVSEMAQWAARYPVPDAAGDAVAFEAGRRLRAGDFDRKAFEQVTNWKSPRPAWALARNTDDEVAEAIRLALAATQPRCAVGVLMSLDGVGCPMASAILTALDQSRWTVIDFRALSSLGVPAERAEDVRFYVAHYLPECRELAGDAGCDLRTVDRALWTWSKLGGKLPALGTGQGEG